ncbi:DUF6527 family protein [Phaeovulum sp.]|uniref:DUF6527 family protein n=1 Tax=Phaeovulum sp. TaxID=2934796 RepID=UPI0035698B38
MTRLGQIKPEFVEFIPENLAPGVLYISKRYSTASHLCCCGCGLEVVTPLNPAKWRLIESDGAISLSPSVGSWSFPCRSHYWISGNRVQWAAVMSAERIAAVKSRDRRDVEAMAPQPQGFFARMVGAIATKIGRWFGR